MNHSQSVQTCFSKEMHLSAITLCMMSCSRDAIRYSTTIEHPGKKPIIKQLKQAVLIDVSYL